MVNHTPLLSLSSGELHTVLAALRFYQEHRQCDPTNRSEWIENIATNGGEVPALTGDEIDEFCERINTNS